MRESFAKIALAAAFGLAIAFTLSCSDEGGGTTIKKARISGVSQKGPFIKGSTADLYEMNGDLSPTGRTIPGFIADNYGRFEIHNVELASPYIMLRADGRYRNEVTGKISDAPIKMQAITDITDRDNVNVNLLTHLEYHRVLKLIENESKSVKEAKVQAQREILAVFGINGEFANSEDMSIFGTTEGDAALLAISVLLLGDLSEGNFDKRLSDFSLEFAENGTWDSNAEKSKIAEWASGADLEGIKENVLAWELSDRVPDFGKYVNEYIAVFCSENKEDKSCSILFDERDGNAYKTVKIGGQTWMARNLGYDAEGSMCYNDSIAYCQKYGRLYDWETAKLACPAGWHLPSDAEWQTLIEFAGRYEFAGKKLKAKNGWGEDGNGTDNYGFSALPGGRGYSNGGYSVGNSGFWWSSSVFNEPGFEFNSEIGYLYSFSNGNEAYQYSSHASTLLSVRCLQD